MAVVKRVGVISCGKVLGILYALLGLIAGGLISLFSMAGAAIGAAEGGVDQGLAGMLFGVGAVVILPLFYGVIGFIGGIIMSAIYNLVASFTGGIEIEIV
jgi:hypothetical protein